MGNLQRWFVAFVLVVGFGVLDTVALTGQSARRQVGQVQPASAEQLFALGNEARAQAGLGRLQWDQALAAAALKHCLRMAAEGPISHRYNGELDLAARTGDAGAHFALIEENIATGPYPTVINQEWLNSPGHRANMLSRDVDHVGMAVVASQGVLYAVADYSRAVREMTPVQIEAAVAGLIRMSGIAVRKDPSDARVACAMSSGLPRRLTGGEPGFVMRWQGADLQHLPQPLVDRLGSGRYHSAAIGSCQADGTENAFSSYRLAVLLY